MVALGDVDALMSIREVGHRRSSVPPKWRVGVALSATRAKFFERVLSLVGVESVVC